MLCIWNVIFQRSTKWIVALPRLVPLSDNTPHPLLLHHLHLSPLPCLSNIPPTHLSLTTLGGEFAFVALGIAERGGLLDPNLSKILMTTVALSMAATPALAELGQYIADKVWILSNPFSNTISHTLFDPSSLTPSLTLLTPSLYHPP